ncbi:MAG: peptide-methionine (S)-S-oxide reductase MsrA [Pseudomonadota bacterium]
MRTNRRSVVLTAAAAVVTVGVGIGVSVGAAQDASEAQASPTATAIYAGGCFWCVEADFEKVDGVVDVVSGYTGGALENPTYEQVTYDDTGHLEAVRVTFDPDRISYRALTDYFLRHIDPLDDGGQFCDRGASYKTAIFVIDDAQRQDALASLAAGQALLSEPIVTPVRAASAFWPAEDYHQDYYKKKPVRYRFYRTRCGRDRRVKAVWGDASTK